MAVTLYPAVGLTVYDHNGDVIPANGVTLSSLTSYYASLVRSGQLTTGNALDASGEDPVEPQTYVGEVNALAYDGATTCDKINAALTAISAAGGGTVVVPQGDYTITGVGTQKIKPKSHTKLVFSPGTTISTGVPTGNSTMFFIESSSVATSLEDIQIEGNGLVVTMDRSTAYVVYGLGCGAAGSDGGIEGVRISDITILDARYDGVNVGGNVGTYCRDIRLDRVRVRNCRRNAGSLTGTITDVIFTDCEFNDTNSDVFTIQSGFDIEVDNQVGFPEASDIQFVRCKFNGNQGQGLYGQNVAYATNTRIKFTDCEANENGYIGFVSSTPNTVLQNCIARKNGSSGFHVTGNSKLNGCLAENNTGSGFSLIGSKNQQTVENCTSRFNGAYGYTLSGYEQATAAMLLANSTAFGNWNKGIYLGQCSGATVMGCTSVLNREEGIDLYQSSHNLITNNYVAANGITVDGASAADNIIVEATSHFNTIHNNTVRRSLNHYRGVAVVDAATTTTTVMLSAWAAASDDAYVGSFARILAGGTEGGASGFITDYNGTTKVATVAWSPALSGAPDGTSVIDITGNRIFFGTVRSATATTVVLESDAPIKNDLLNDCYVRVRSGAGVANTPKLISDYDGTTKTLTTATWSPVLTEDDQIEIVCVKRPRYGIRVNAGCIGNSVQMNDAWYAGFSGGYSDAGTSTVATAANRTT